MVVQLTPLNERGWGTRRLAGKLATGESPKEAGGLTLITQLSICLSMSDSHAWLS